MRMDFSLKHPFSMLVSGRRDVGKTEYRNKLLKSKLIANPPERTVCCYAKHQQDLFEELMKMNVEYVKGIPGELDKYFMKSKKNLIILDILMDEVSRSFTITSLLTCGCHNNLLAIYLTQNLFHTNQRALSLNFDNMMIFQEPLRRFTICYYHKTNTSG